jgi:hypothetical protein
MSVRSKSHKLGKRIATYFPSDKHLRERVVALGCLGVVGIWLLAKSLSPTPNAGWLALSLVLVVGSIIDLANVWRRHARRVHLHQRGFEFEQYSELQSILWSEISDIWQTPVYASAGRGIEPANWIIRIRALDGRKIKLSGFDGIRSVAHRAQESLSARLFSHYQEAFRAGSWIRFGKKLAVSDEGLNIGMKAISWYEINDIFLDDEDGIRIGHCQEGTKWIHLPIGSISNFQLLTRFLSWVKSTQSLSLEDNERQVDENRAVGLFDHVGTSGHDDDARESDVFEPDVCEPDVCEPDVCEPDVCEPDVFESSVHKWDVNELAASGFERDEIDDVLKGDCTMDELLARGPRRRPRVPK